MVCFKTLQDCTSSFVGVNWSGSSTHSGNNEAMSQVIIAVLSSSGDNEILFLAISKLQTLFAFSTVTGNLL